MLGLQENFEICDSTNQKIIKTFIESNKLMLF